MLTKIFSRPLLGGNFRYLRLFVALFLMTIKSVAEAQIEGGGGHSEGSDGPTAVVTIECDRVCVQFTGIQGALGNQWDFGDGNKASGLTVTHCYKDANFYTMTWKHRVSPFDPWVSYEFPLKAIFVGEGCGSVRKISDLIPKVLPPNNLDNSTIYAFGNLEANINYQFNGCTFNILPGSVVKLIDKVKLVLNGGIMQPHAPLGCEQALWNGLEPQPYTELVTMGGLSISYALYGIRPVASPHTLGPLLKISNTTFDRNFIGICGISGQFGLETFQGNIFSGGPIPYSVKFCAGGNLPGGIPYLNWSYAGIYVDGISRASLWMPLGSTANTFSNLPVGIFGKSCDMYLSGCTFNNILLSYLNTGMPLDMHGTAIIAKINVPDRIIRINQLTVNTADRGILFDNTEQNTALGITRSQINNVQNGVEVHNNGIDFECIVSFNKILCNRYLNTALKHKPTATGIEITNLGASRYLFVGQNKDINLDFTPVIALLANPIGINLINMSAPSIYTSDGYVYDNKIIISSGTEGIRLENAVNFEIHENNVLLNTPAGNQLDVHGIHLIGGRDNEVGCNDIIGGSFAHTTGIFSEGSENIHSVQNVISRTLGGEIFFGYHNTSCIIGGNQFIAMPFDPLSPLGIGRGLSYLNAITGPQDKTGNVWDGDYEFGALFFGSLGNSYCFSQYNVTLQSNVGDNTLNPLFTNFADFGCSGWFEIQDGIETAPYCFMSTQEGANYSDLQLASRPQMPQGIAWASETGLYSKFMEHPEWINGQAAIQNFIQACVGQSVAQMHNVRSKLSAIQVPMATEWIERKQLLENKEVLLNDLAVAWTTGDTNLIAEKKYALDTMEQNLESLRTATSLQSLVAIDNLKTASNAINCTTQPCLYEHWLYQLYTEVELQKTRTMTDLETEQLRILALECPTEAGASVYWARSWHYLRTGERLTNACATPFPENLEERGRQIQETLAIAGMKVQPNPTTGSTTLLLPTMEKEAQVSLMDVYGRLVYESSIAADTKSLDLNLQSHPAGTYLLRLRDVSGKFIAQTKIIVAH